MARIESGISPESAGQFWLKGQTLGLGQAQDQREEQRKREAEMHDYQIQIQKAALEYQQEKAKSQALLNSQAQMGDAQALQNLSIQIHAGEHPDAKILQDAMGTMQKITDPKARALALKAFDSAMKDLHAQRRRQSADQDLQRAQENGLIKPEDAQSFTQRMDSGEEPQNITKELHKAEQDLNVKTLASQKAAEAIAQGEAIVQSLPPGRHKLAAEYVLTHFKNAPADQANPDGAANFLKELHMAALPSQKEMDTQAKLKKEHLQETLGPNAQAMGLPGMTVGEMQDQLGKTPHGPVGFGLFGDSFGAGGPSIPQLDQTKLPKNRAQPKGRPSGKPKATDIAQVFGASKSAEDFHHALEQLGIDPMSDEGAKLIIEALGGSGGAEPSH